MTEANVHRARDLSRSGVLSDILSGYYLEKSTAKKWGKASVSPARKVFSLVRITFQDCRISTWYKSTPSSMNSPTASSYAFPDICAPPCTWRKENFRHKSWVSQSEFWGQLPSELPFKVQKVIKSAKLCLTPVETESLAMGSVAVFRIQNEVSGPAACGIC